MAEPQAFDPSKPFTLVPPPPPLVDAATQREIDLGLRLPPQVVEKLNTPLFHPTGINLIDGLTSPANIGLTAVLGGRSAAKALAVAGEAISAGVDSAVVNKVLKFLTPTKFREGMDVLSELAKAAATKGEAPAIPASPAPVVEPVASAPVAPAPQAAVAAPPVASAPRPVAPSPRGASAPSPVAPSPVPQAPPPDVMQRLSPATEAAVSPPPPATMGPDGQLVGRPGGNPAMPDQKALNEAALAVRRAAYQARMSSAPPVEAPVAAAPAANVKLSAPETKAFLDLMKRGFSGPDAMKSVLQQRQLVEMLGSPTPTAAETRFPKGQRGKLMSQP